MPLASVISGASGLPVAPLRSTPATSATFEIDLAGLVELGLRHLGRLGFELWYMGTSPIGDEPAW